ncbi:hypothetical protein QYE76_012637 [Lolium multiflorum]|uniref:Transposase (putative) gypsy type domain-containing protein n=1 Tax=Lolium multiflorum TaxID=4521 RepID=A0AAD8U1H0_LOLMU|nr:hypothetical protein QYE76_012637 [Lolium multiflorum]
MGSNVTKYEIDWLYRSRRIPEGVTCRIPDDEIVPDPQPGERVVFLAHFERGFGLPPSSFFLDLLDFYKLQPHHLPGNSIFYLSCYATFMEAYIGIRPTLETFARFFALRINSVQGLDIPKPKPPVQCGSCIISSRQGSPFFKFSGLESCRLWQGTFFYVKNNGAADLIGLPPFDPAPPAKTNWGYNPKESHNETNRIIRFMRQKMKDTGICSDDIVRTFISRRVLPLKRRAHRMSEMYGPGDPTKITGHPLSKKDVVLKAKQICQTAMPFNWEWGLLPSALLTLQPKKAARNLPETPLTPSTRSLHLLEGSEDGQDRSRLGRSPPKPTGSSDDPTMLEIHEHVPPLRAEAGSEFVDKLMAQGQKNKRPSSDDGSSQAPPSKRFRTEPLGEKKVGMRRYGRQMPTASGPALKLGPRPSGSSVPQGPQPLLSLKPAPPGADHRTEEDLPSSQNQDTGTSNIGAGEEDATGRAEPPAPPVPEKRQLPRRNPPRRKVPTRVMRLSLPLLHEPSSCRRQVLLAPSLPWPLLPRHRPFQAHQGEGDGLQRPFCRQQPVLHVSKAARTATKATGLLGRHEFKRRGQDLGHLLPYAQKWNAADVTPATRGLGKDRLPAPDPVGARVFRRALHAAPRAVKELDSAWYDATNNLMLTADARKTLFEELLWEHRELAEAHDKCQGEKDQLIQQHQEELSAHKTSYQELKSQLIQLGLDHAKVLKAAEADAAAKMNEALEDASNATVVLRAELEELAKARKGAEEKAARLEEEHKECNQLILQTDALAYRLFPDSQTYAVKKVNARRPTQSQANLAVPWTPNDHLVALNARVSHMRAIDRNLSDIPDVATQLFRTLWPGEEVSDTFSLISDRLKGAGRRIREWRLAARAGADSASASLVPGSRVPYRGVRRNAHLHPPPDVQDYLDEEEDEAEEEPLDDAGAATLLRKPLPPDYLP